MKKAAKRDSLVKPELKAPTEQGGFQYDGLRALSPFEVFRRREFAEEPRGERRNPASKETITYLKRKWRDLSSEEKNLCEGLAASTKAMAKANRMAVHRSRDLAVAHAAEAVEVKDEERSFSALAAHVAEHGAIVPLESGEIPGPLVPAGLAIETYAYDTNICMNCESLATHPKYNQAGERRPQPWNENALRAFYKGQGQFEGLGNLSKMKCARVWQKLMANSGDTSTFPDAVTYESCCGAACQVAAPMEHVRRQQELKKHLSQLVNKATGNAPASVSRSKLFVVIECPGELPSFFRITEATARSGRYPPTQMFLRLSVEEFRPRPFVGMILKVIYEPYMKPYTDTNVFLVPPLIASR